MIKTFTRKSVLTVPLAALTLAVSSAYAATPGPSDASFYNPPASLTGSRGDLISYRSTTPKLGTGAPAVNAWNVIYQSKNAGTKNQADQDIAPKDNAVSGTVLVPTAAWTGGGDRPVILYAVGTQGLANGCAPSRQFDAGTEYENANIVAALKAGYAVLVSDYAGYLNGQQATYLAGRSQGHAILDIFKAATQIPSSGVSATAKIGIWGFSQGGQTSAWAGELLSSYAPELQSQVVGVAMGGIPANFRASAEMLDKNLGFAFLASGVNGLGAEYGQKGTYGIPIGLVASQAGKDALAKLQTQCVFEALLTHENQSLTQYTQDPSTLSDLLDTVDGVMNMQNLGNNPIPVPVYQFHGKADEFIGITQDYAYKKQLCAKGTTVQFDVYPSEHIATQFQAAPYALSWMADRFAGKAAPNSCNTSRPDPVSTNATPNGGDLIVNMDKWKLGASVHLRTLMQDFPEPDASTFSAVANLTTKKITGQVAIPDFAYPVKIVGIPFSTGMSIAPAADMTGSVELDNAGLLHVHGSVPMNLTITSLWGIPMGKCAMTAPVVFPLDFDGPISSFGNGSLTFKGTTTFPQIKGCIISAILSALVSGTGQQFTFTVSPPAPVSN
ncbi:MAG: lipase family protein [Aquabacterium sp.]